MVIVCTCIRIYTYTRTARTAQASNLSDVDGGLLGSHAVVVVGGVALSVGGGDFGWFLDVVGCAVGGVGALEGTGVLGSDGGEDGVGSGDGSGLVGLVLDSWVGAGVEQDEGVLLGGDGSEVSLTDGVLQGGDAAAVCEARTLDGGAGDGTVGGGHGWDANEGGSSDGTHGGTAVHVERGAGTLWSGRSECGSRGDKEGGDDGGELHGGRGCVCVYV
mmetsp:Transcript_27063/g.76139  ORF Transcript_27063/g.76139 Transcript_27063/m.76139 type:complete len:217 (+) Transcript_27063:143-793(+)